MAKKATNLHAEQLAFYTMLIESHPLIDRKGKTMPYTSLNGHMFSFLDKEGKMGLRLAKDEIEKFLTDFRTELSVQHGSVMKEYVVVPDDLLADTKQLLPFLEKSYQYVLTLKTKPTKRKK